MFERGQAREVREERQRMVTLYATARDAGSAVEITTGRIKKLPGWTPPPYLTPEGADAQPVGKSGQDLWDEVDLFMLNLKKGPH